MTTPADPAERQALQAERLRLERQGAELRALEPSADARIDVIHEHGVRLAAHHEELRVFTRQLERFHHAHGPLDTEV